MASSTSGFNPLPQTRLDSTQISSSTSQHNKSRRSSRRRPKSLDTQRSVDTPMESNQDVEMTDQQELPETPVNDSPFNSLVAELSMLTTSSTHVMDSSLAQGPRTISDSPASNEGYYSVTSSSQSNRSFGSVTDSMSDLIITTGHERLDRQTGSFFSTWVSQTAETEARGTRPAEERERSNTYLHTDETASYTPMNSPFMAHAAPLPSLNGRASLQTTYNELNTDCNHQIYNVLLPSAMPNRLSALSPAFVPRHAPMRLNDMYDTTVGRNYSGIDPEDKRSQIDCNKDYRLHGILLSHSSDSLIDVSSAAEDEALFAEDDYDDQGSLKVRIPDSMQSTIDHRRALFPSDSGLSLIPPSVRLPIGNEEDIQTSHSPLSQTLSPVVETHASLEYAPLDSSLLASTLQVPTMRSQEQSSDGREDLTPRAEYHRELELSADEEGRDYFRDIVATPRKPKRSDKKVTISEESPVSMPARIHAPSGEEMHVEEDRSTVLGLVACDTCRSADKLFTRTRMSPCGHLACFSCLTASINIVSASGTKARCTCCQQTVSDFSPGQKISQSSSQEASKAAIALEKLKPSLSSYPGFGSADSGVLKETTPVIMRIDNIAWDATPEMLEQFLPPGVLADTLQPVHLLIVRQDGRSKDYLFIEVKNIEAAHKVLQTRQNVVLGTGSRARPVTITLTTEEKLVEELQPESRAEVMGLLELCHTALARNIGHDDYNPKNNGILGSLSSNSSLNLPSSDSVRSLNGGSPLRTGRFLKSRYAPFWSVLSLVSRLTTGHEVYWDMFLVISGAIAVLAKHLASNPSGRITSNKAMPRFNQDSNRTETIPRFAMSQLPAADSFQAVASAQQLPATESDPKVAELNAKIHKKLEEEMVRESKISSGRVRTRLYQSPVKQQYTGGMIDDGGADASNRRDWSNSDATMLQKFVQVFESQFGVKVNLKHKI